MHVGQHESLHHTTEELIRARVRIDKCLSPDGKGPFRLGTTVSNGNCWYDQYSHMRISLHHSVPEVSRIAKPLHVIAGSSKVSIANLSERKSNSHFIGHAGLRKLGLRCSYAYACSVLRLFLLCSHVMQAEHASDFSYTHPINHDCVQPAAGQGSDRCRVDISTPNPPTYSLHRRRCDNIGVSELGMCVSV